MAGDVLTTATAGAEGAARIGESADSAQLSGQDRGETDQVTVTGPQTVTPANLQSSPGETTPRTPRGVSDGGASASDTRPAATTRPTRQTRQGPAPAAQPSATKPTIDFLSRDSCTCDEYFSVASL